MASEISQTHYIENYQDILQEFFRIITPDVDSPLKSIPPSNHRIKTSDLEQSDSFGLNRNSFRLL